MLKTTIPAVAGLALIGGALFGYVMHRQVTNTWVRVTATVVGEETRTVRGNPAGKTIKTHHYPKLSFATADGKVVEALGDAHRLKSWPVGEKVTVSYSTTDPSNVTMIVDWQRLAAIGIAALFGFGLLAVGLGII